ncbi:Parkin coregulated protein [Aphelenchoides besseyi]|nr:Parkin coregulated protein [Aphelenchoides besseyi]KAI6194213.1 Parkin coregulated protein [Aphelenchoides besseyi]
MIPYDVTRACRNPRFRSWSPVFKVDCSRNIVKDNKRQQILYQPRRHSLRRVPAFTIQSEQKATKPFTPVSAPARRSNNSEMETKFVKFYEDRQLPVRVVNSSTKRNIEWLVNPAELTPTETCELIQKICCGLSIERPPYDMIALRTFQDLISLNDSAHCIARTLNDVMLNIRLGLQRGIKKRMEMLDLLRRISALNGIGPVLIPYYRMLLPALRRVTPTVITENIATSERDRLNEEILHTLHDLERSGGRHAFINIKYILPDYQSVVST